MGGCCCREAIAYYPQLARLLFACMTESHFSALHATSVCVCGVYVSNYVAVALPLSLSISVSVSTLAIGSQLRLKHLKLGACHEMQTLHFDCQPETINQSQLRLAFPLPLLLSASPSLSCLSPTSPSVVVFICHAFCPEIGDNKHIVVRKQWLC